MNDLPHIAARAFNTPLLIEPRKAEIISSVLHSRLVAADSAVALDDARKAFSAPARTSAAAPTRFDGEPRGPRRRNAYGEEYQQTRYMFGGGAALISVHGTLVNKGAWIGSNMSGLSSYEGLAASLEAAAADDEVEVVVLDFDSPGGEAIGAFETADLVRAIDARKPVIAYVDGYAASAAYAIASGAREIVMRPSSAVGSIGVVILHLDRSGQYAKAGVKPTLIYAGEHKVDGNPFEPLSEDDQKRFQDDVANYYEMFLDTVSKRPALSREAARATQASMFTAALAIERGLADRVGTLDEAIAGQKPRSRAFAFAKGKRSLPMANVDESLHTQAALDAAVTNAVAAARRDADVQMTAAVAQARTAERERIRSILDGEAAKGKGALARHFALTTDMSPEAAAAALAAAAPEAPPAASRIDRAPRVDIAPGATQRDVNPQAEVDATWAAIAAKNNARLPAAARRG